MFPQIELAALFNWAVLPTATPDDVFNDPELIEAAVWARGLSKEDKNGVLSALNAWLSALDATKATALLVLGGELVEHSASPDLLLEGSLAHLARLQQLHDAGDLPSAAVWRFTVIGLMALLCRSAKGRALFKQQTKTLAWLEQHFDLSDHFFYLERLTQLSDEEVLWVLFPAYETGLEVSAFQVNNTFHLLTLLQPLVLEHASALQLQTRPEMAPDEVLYFAQGYRDADASAGDSNRWEWLNALAYQGGPLDPMHLAWGETPVSLLPRVRGNVLLLATENENCVKRSWDAGFLATMHDANLPKVSVRRLLPPAEVRSLLDEIHPPVEAF